MKKIRTPILICLLFLSYLLSVSELPSQTLYRIREGGLWGYIDSTGDVAIKPRYDFARDFHEGLAAVRINGYYGFINLSGEFIIKPSFEYARDFHDSLAVVASNGIFNYVNNRGKFLIPGNRCSKASDFEGGHAVIEVGGFTKWAGRSGIINLNGTLLIDTIYSYIIPSENGDYVMKYEGDSSGFAVADKLGTFVVPLYRYKNVDVFRGEYAEVESADDNVYKFINADGNEIRFGQLPRNTIDTLVTSYGGSEGLFVFGITKISQDSGRMTFKGSHIIILDTSGNVVLQDVPMGDNVRFTNGRAFIPYHGNLLIDRNGRRIGNYSFSAVSQFQNGYCIAAIDDRWGLIDTSGEFVIQPIFEGIYYFSSDYIIGKKTDCSVYDLRGHRRFNTSFDDFDKRGYINGLLNVQIKGLNGYINTLGEFVWKEKESSAKGPNKINIDYRLNPRRYLNNNSITDTTQFPKNEVAFIFQTDQHPIFENKYDGYNLFFSNLTDQDLKMPWGSHLYLMLWALDSNGEWKTIENNGDLMGDDSFTQPILRHGSYSVFVVPHYYGGFKTHIRASLVIRAQSGLDSLIFSNVIEGEINRAQFWRNREPFYNLDYYDKLYY